MHKRFSIAAAFFISFSSAFAQEKLSLQDAIAIALKNNYSILIYQNQEQEAANLNTSGNAGFLPSAGVSGSGNESVSDIKQNYSTGSEVNRKNVSANNLAGTAGVNWTIFDGFKMFATKNKLDELQSLSHLITRAQMENMVEQIISSYFNVVKENQLLKAAKEAIDIYEERVRIAQTKFDIGSSSKIDLLQAKVDFNAQRSEQINEQTALRNAKINLNRLLSRSVETEYTVADTAIPVVYHPAYDDLKTSIVKQNDSLQMAQRNVNISALMLRETQSQRYPRLGINTNYNFSRTNNGAGLILLNQNAGLNYGFTVSWNLFNGSVINAQVKNAKLDYQNSMLSLNYVKIQVEANLLIAFQNFQSTLQLLNLEEDNLTLAKENVAVALERYRVGKATQLELTEAQKSLDDAVNRTVSARYDTKIAETSLMKLNGALVK